MDFSYSPWRDDEMKRDSQKSTKEILLFQEQQLNVEAKIATFDEC